MQLKFSPLWIWPILQLMEHTENKIDAKGGLTS
jgi:hypothetical protein